MTANAEGSFFRRAEGRQLLNTIEREYRETRREHLGYFKYREAVKNVKINYPKRVRGEILLLIDGLF